MQQNCFSVLQRELCTVKRFCSIVEYTFEHEITFEHWRNVLFMLVLLNSFGLALNCL